MELRCGLPLVVRIVTSHVRGHSIVNGCLRHVSTETSRKIKTDGVAVVFAAVLFGAAFVYKQIRALEKQLNQRTNVFENEKLNQTFIFLENHEQSIPEEHRERFKTKKKKHVWFPRIQSRTDDPWILLKLAQSDTHRIRVLGIKGLVHKHVWTDGDYQMLAQALDKRTLVALARTPNADPRFFLPPPRLKNTPVKMLWHLRNLLATLPTTGLDECTQYFMKTALDTKIQSLKEERDAVWTFDGNGILEEKPRAMPSSSRQETYCLQALLGHSRIGSHCYLMVEKGGLLVLHRLLELRQDNVKVLRYIARILANITLYEDLHQHIIDGGWVGVLAGWLKSSDMALSLHAAKALANLDTDDTDAQCQYQDGIYLYHPQYRYDKPIYADVVFVHGLLGGPFKTWRQTGEPKKENSTVVPVKLPASDTQQGTGTAAGQETIQRCQGECQDIPVKPDQDSVKPDGQLLSNTDKANVAEQGSGETEKEEQSSYTYCWPKDWLAKDCPHIRILTVEYETQLSQWSPKCPYDSEKRTLQMRSEDFLKKLKEAGLGERPIIWVGHSMGGLMIKQMLSVARDDAGMENILNNTEGVVFYSVPHHGSPLAALGNQTKYILLPSLEVKELARGSSQLQELHDKFKDLMSACSIRVLSFAEGLKTEIPLNMKVMIVPINSSDPDFGELHILEDSDHLNVCKPDNKESPIYKLCLDFIRSCVPLSFMDDIVKAGTPEEYIFPEKVDFHTHHM